MEVSPSTLPARSGFAAHPLLTFFALACAITWSLVFLAKVSVAFSLLALFGPAAAAWITASLCGPEARSDLWQRITHWRLPLRWYVLALLLPLPISALSAGIARYMEGDGTIRLVPITALSLIVFVLVIGEEIGWRGFALPRLLARHGRWGASAILGVAWAVWHLPLFYMEGMPQHNAPFLPYIGYTVALSLLLTVLAVKTAGSVVIATLFHGAVNTFILANSAASDNVRGWSNGVAFSIAALVICGVAWRREMRA